MNPRLAQSRSLHLVIMVSVAASCASAPSKFGLREWAGGNLAYVLADPPIYISLSRERGEQLGLGEAERYLADLARRLKPHVATLQSKGTLPALCNVNVRLLYEPVVSCIGPLGGGSVESLEALLHVTVVPPRQKAGATQDTAVQVEFGSKDGQ